MSTLVNKPIDDPSSPGDPGAGGKDLGNGIDPATIDDGYALPNIDATGNSVTEKSTLAELNIPRRNDRAGWLKIRNGLRHQAQLITGTDGKTLSPIYPFGYLGNSNSSSLTLSVGSTELSPSFQLTCQTHRETDGSVDRIHIGHIRWFIGAVYTTTTRSKASGDYGYEWNVGHAGISNVHAGEIVNNAYFDLEFTCTFGVTSNLGPPHDVELVQEELDLLACLRELALPSTKTVKLRVILSKQDITSFSNGNTIDIKRFFDEFGTLSCRNKPLYAPYLRVNGCAQAMPNAMKRVFHRLKDGSPHIPIRAFNEFVDPLEAEVQLSYDVDAEHQEGLLFHKQFETAEHQARFISYGANVLALVNLGNRDKIRDARILLEHRADVLVYWKSNKQAKFEQSAKFLVVENVFSLGVPADLILVCKNKDVGYFHGSAVDYTQIDRVEYKPMRLKVVSADTTYKRRISITHTIWDLQHGKRDLWPLLLNQSPESLPSTNAFELANVPNDEADKALRGAMHRVVKFTNLDSNQLATIQGVKSMRAKMQIMQSPSGTGKTRFAAILAQMYGDAGIATLITAPNNTAADQIADELTSKFITDVEPIRVLASSISNGLDTSVMALMHNTDESAIQDTIEDITTISLIALMKASKGKLPRPALDNELSSVTVRRCMDRSLTVITQYSNEKGEPHGANFNMAEELRGFLVRLQDPAVDKSFKHWNYEDKARFNQSKEIVMANILAHAKVLITTTTNAGSKLICQNVGRESRGLAVMIDEAGRDREVDSYFALAASDKTVVAMHLFGDIQQGISLHFSIGNFNEFRARGELSLMARLIAGGFPYITFTRQFRMHPTIFAYPNERFYGNKMISDQSTIHNNYLKPAVATILKDIIGLDHSEPDNKARLHYVEIINSKVLKSKLSRSRANLEHVAWIRKELVAGFIRKFQVDYPGMELNMSMLPRIYTVDSAHGIQGDIVFLDLVNTEADRPIDVGFMAEEQRACVAFTRALKAFIMVGGPMEGRQNERKMWNRTRVCAILEYKASLRNNDLIRMVSVNPAPHPLPWYLEEEDNL
ncbi:uncharacterized protein K452DRAFT_302586 [Aplosporella prunicola CBS 121167]|uniref:DNA2/NAM7 helicase-like C-terminal domain-containing protein n=1 Tax=Aplosporella prunicola CBS 121167 TaxID=1176127 RepID=A0A6A6B1N8_9PEZI|nr:uncharacterized protein K452DRAFT_302586 [Aplosporella prunicola CBS 121167]KAF2136641.1 hypothetical protein K452DRAFT_302586 [Aplosporella prunicola CBS 121167]